MVSSGQQGSAGPRSWSVGISGIQWGQKVGLSAEVSRFQQGLPGLREVGHLNSHRKEGRSMGSVAQQDPAGCSWAKKWVSTAQLGQQGQDVNQPG